MIHLFWRILPWWNWFNIILYSTLLFVWLSFQLMQKFITYAGWGGVRRRGNELQTPIVTYEHPVSGRRVICVGMVHIGEKGYFDAIQLLAHVCELRRYVVLYEKVSPPANKQERADLTYEERRFLIRRRGLRAAMRKEIAPLGLVYQMDALTYRLTWINTDMDLVTLIRSLSPSAKMLTFQPSLITSDIDEQWLKMRLNRMLATLGFSAFVMNRTPWTGTPKQVLDVILTRRNEIAIRGIRAYPAQDAIALWGAGHLWGIGKHLVRDGYREIRREWLTVYHIRHFGWWESTRLTIRMYWKVIKQLGSS